MWVLWIWRRHIIVKGKHYLWQVLRTYGVGRKLLNGINSMYVNSLACVRLKEGESECFRIDSGVIQGWIT